MLTAIYAYKPYANQRLYNEAFANEPQRTHVQTLCIRGVFEGQSQFDRILTPRPYRIPCRPAANSRIRSEAIWSFYLHDRVFTAKSY